MIPTLIVHLMTILLPEGVEAMIPHSGHLLETAGMQGREASPGHLLRLHN